MRVGIETWKAWGGVALAAAGVVAAFATGRLERGEARTDHSRLIVVGVPGMSWETVLPLVQEDALPFMASRLDATCAVGDIIATGYSSPDEVMASIITGKFTAKHGVRPGMTMESLDGNKYPGQRVLWDLLAEAGEEVAAVGWPISYVPVQPGVMMVPGADLLPGVGLENRVVPADVPVTYIDEVAPPGALPGQHEEELRMSLAADLTVLRIVRGMQDASPDAHLFIYLPGLRQWQDHAAAHDGEFDDAVQGYYRMIDRFLAQVATLGDADTTFLVVSEDGNHGEPITYRPYFPKLDTWPPIGFFMTWGRGIKEGVLPHMIAPADIAPTALYLAGTAVPNSMDGLVLFGLLEDDYYFKHMLRLAR